MKLAAGFGLLALAASSAGAQERVSEPRLEYQGPPAWAREAVAGTVRGDRLKYAYPPAATVIERGQKLDVKYHSVLRWAEDPRSDMPVDGLLASMPILLKDNIETRDMPATAGSLALAGNAPGRDAPLVTRLRAAGAVIIGKTNLSEWANIRSSNSISGWSAVGGLTPNPYDPTRTACGSSSGSAVAVAVGLAPVAIGTETNGSITCPASVNGVVGFKPTVGLDRKSVV